jgi:predicted nuclease with TOPRIM domain
VRQLERANLSATSKNGTLSAELDQVRDAHDALNERLDAASKEQAFLTERLRDTEDERDSQRAEIKQLEAAAASLEQNQLQSESG